MKAFSEDKVKREITIHRYSAEYNVSTQPFYLFWNISLFPISFDVLLGMLSRKDGVLLSAVVDIITNKSI